MLLELLGLGVLVIIVLSLLDKDFHKAFKKTFPHAFCKHKYKEYKYKVPLKSYYVIGKSCTKCKKIKKHSTHIKYPNK